MESSSLTDESGIVQRLRDARHSPVVLKSKLAAIRAHCDDKLVFAFEGTEDKTVYFHWLKQIAPLLSCEFLICNGKAKVLELRELLKKDVTGLGKLVFYFVDRDFDDLRGSPAGDDIFMTDHYSVENYLVCRNVLEAVLTVDLHCHGEPAKRESVLNIFEELYDTFLENTKEINQRIYFARTLGIANTRPWPDKINLLAKVSLVNVEASDRNPSEIVVLSREPSPQEVDARIAEFEAINPRQHFRGKFALLFFQRWIQLLGEDRISSESRFFKGMERTSSANGRLPLESLAAKSTPPDMFRTFISNLLSTLAKPHLSVQNE